MDFTILSMRISSFVMVCGRVLQEVGLFLMALIFAILAFATSISALEHQLPDFEGVDSSMVSLLLMSLRMYPTSGYKYMKDEPWVLVTVCMFAIVIMIFFLNLLIAQLNQAYQVVYEDMQGFARLNRASVIVATLVDIGPKRWKRFLTSLRFDERLEFNEGDIGLAGGIQILEPSNANPTTVDVIKRFGGSTSPTMPWPEEEEDGDDDRFDRLEKLIVRTTKSITGKRKKGGATASSMGGSGVSGQSKSESSASSNEK
eukprot:Skav228291  [mRNA]  locus=scaffold209:45654:54358:- [translate_table: standard]